MDDIVVAGIVASVVATTGAALLLYRYVLSLTEGRTMEVGTPGGESNQTRDVRRRKTRIPQSGAELPAWVGFKSSSGMSPGPDGMDQLSLEKCCRADLLAFRPSNRRLTLRLFPPSSSSPSAQTSSYTFALLTSALFLFAPSRPTLHAAPYTEPFAAFFTFLGMYLLYSPRRSVGSEIGAALAWALGSSVRAQGTTLGVGFFGWRYLLQRPSVRGRFSATVRRIAPCPTPRSRTETVRCRSGS